MDLKNMFKIKYIRFSQILGIKFEYYYKFGFQTKFTTKGLVCVK